MDITLRRQKLARWMNHVSKKKHKKIEMSQVQFYYDDNLNLMTINLGFGKKKRKKKEKGVR